MPLESRSFSIRQPISAYLQKTRYAWMILIATVAVLLAILLPKVNSVYSSPIPTISILSVNQGESVTIRTHNFPANHIFAVSMGKMGTRGIGGDVITTVASGSGGSFNLTYAIPEALKNERQVAIRLQTGHANPYFAYNWFYNAATITGGRPPATPVAPVYVGIPTFIVTAVQKNTNVTISTNNFPPNQTFDVTMGRFGTRGLGGVSVGTINSGAGGAATHTFTIPSALSGLDRLAIRAQTAHANPYLAYNWFYNNDANTAPAPAGTGGQQIDPPQPPAAPTFVGTPSFKVCGVNRNNNVTIVTSALPPGHLFYVTMGNEYSQGIGGISAESFPSKTGEPQRVTFTIPAQLQGLGRIAIRIQTNHATPYFAYNWFYNNTASVC